MFKKGESGNPKGRPIGIKSKSGNTILLERIKTIISNNIDDLDDTIKQLEPMDKVKALTALMQYVLPKMQAVDVTNQMQMEYREIQLLMEKTPDAGISALAGKMLDIETNNNSDNNDLSGNE